MSKKLSAAALTRIRTSPGPAVGFVHLDQLQILNALKGIAHNGPHLKLPSTNCAKALA